MSIPSELIHSLYNFLSEKGYEKSASYFLKESKLDKKSIAKNTVKLNEIYSIYISKSAVSSSSNKPVAKTVESSSSDDDDDDDDSDDEDDDSEDVPVKATTKPVVSKPQLVSAKLPAKQDDDDDSDDDDSDSDDDDDSEDVPVKATAKPVVSKPQPVPVVAAKPTISKVVAKPAQDDDSDDDDDDDSDDDSDSDDTPPPKKVVAAKPQPVAAVVTKGKPTKPADDDDSDDDDEEEEEKPLPPAKRTKIEPTKPPAAVVAPVINNNNKQKGGETFRALVKGLPWLATESEVADFFVSCGKIQGVELPLGEDGRSSGTAIVTFGSRSEFEAAIALDGQLWPDTERWLKILDADKISERKSFGGGDGPGVKPDGCDTLFVGNLSWDIEEQQLWDLFSQAGEVASVRFATSKEDGSFRGFGHVSFVDPSSLEEAIKLNGTPVNGRALRLDFAPPKAARESFGGGGGRGGGRDGGGRGGGRGGGGRDGGRGGGRGGRSPGRGGAINKNKGTIAPSTGSKKTFD